MYGISVRDPADHMISDLDFFAVRSFMDLFARSACKDRSLRYQERSLYLHDVFLSCAPPCTKERIFNAPWI